MTDGDLSNELTRVFRLEQQLAARRLELVREAEGRDLARRDGAASMVAWLCGKLRVTPSAARRMVELAKALDARCAATAAALAAGAVSEDQAWVIARTATELASQPEVSPEVRLKAEQRLIADAADFEPHSLAKLASRVLENVAPELAEEQLRRKLAADDQRAQRDRTFTMSPDGTGRVRLSGWLAAEAAAIVNAAMDPLCAPAGPADDRTPGQRRADALTDVCRLALATGDLPENGGEKPQVVVMLGHDDLVAATGAGMLDTGQLLPPEAVRRLACDAGIISAVLGGQGQVLDVGRERRLFTGSLRRALVLRDGGCAFSGCDRPPRWADGHHVKHWADGGPTCLSNAVLLCGFHHRLIHHSDWQVRIAPDGLPEFTPPAWIDPQQVPRRNHYHRRT